MAFSSSRINVAESIGVEATGAVSLSVRLVAVARLLSGSVVFVVLAGTAALETVLVCLDRSPSVRPSDEEVVSGLALDTIDESLGSSKGLGNDLPSFGFGDSSFSFEVI